MDSPQDTIHVASEVVANVASKFTYGGAGSTVIGFLTSNEFLGVMGFVVALAGFVVNFYFRRKQDKRNEAEHEATMARLTSGDWPNGIRHGE